MENTEEHYFEKWTLLVHKAFADYELLNDAEIVWFNVQCLINDVCNGGLISFYYNSGAEHMADTLTGLKAVEAPEIYDIVDQINQAVFNGNVPADLDARNAVINQINNSTGTLLNKLDDEFFKHEETLQFKLDQFAKNAGLI